MPPHNLLTPALTKPAGSRISKRPLHRPPLPSSYAGASERKIVYVSFRTPFLSAVKRVEKLLRLADRRLIQSATTTVANRNTRSSKRKWRSGGADEDDVMQIAEEIERTKGKRKRGGGGGSTDMGMREEVVIKGTGKAIARVMEMGVWFQQRQEEYKIRLQTGSAACIDDIDMGEERDGETGRENDMNEERTVNEAPEGEGDGHREGSDGRAAKAAIASGHEGTQADGISKMRLRYTSVLEVYVSLR